MERSEGLLRDSQRLRRRIRVRSTRDTQHGGYEILRLLFDTESNGFVATATKVHCVGITNVDTGEYKGYRPEQIKDAIAELDKADVLIGHNIARHDNPLLKKLYQFTPRPGVLIKDTMVLSRVIFPNLKATDTALIEAQKMPPKYRGKHSMGAWGYRLGNPKGDYAQIREAAARANGLDDPKAIAEYVWGTFNEDMFSYMAQDVSTNFDLWKHLRPDEYPQAPLDLEHRVARTLDAMEKAGVPFDLKAAGELQAELVGRKHEIETKLKERYGFWYAPTSPDPSKSLFVPKKANADAGYWGDEWVTEEPDPKKPGKTKKKKHFKGYPCTKIKPVEFNPGSAEHLAKVLQSEGWKPTKFTDGGRPAMDEEVIESIGAQFPAMEELATLLMINKRLSQLVGGASSKYPLIDCVKEDGRIHGVISPMGTITSRCSHMFPNLGQVPSAKKPYGKAFREMFYAPKGWTFLGADMAGLELRALAHYLHPLDGGKYADVVLDGDVHWMHTEVMGLAEGERDKHNNLHTIVREDGAKRFIYGYIYGCGDHKAGEIIYECLLNARRNAGEEGEKLYSKFFKEGVVGEKQLRAAGRSIRNAFLTRINGFGTLQKKIAEQVGKRGRIIGLDGRIIPIRSEHSALNFMLQSAGAIITKRWLTDAFDECSRRFNYNHDNPWAGEFVFVLYVHDELQLCVRKGLEEEIGNIIIACAQKAGEPYGFRVRLDSSYDVGANWGATH